VYTECCGSQRLAEIKQKKNVIYIHFNTTRTERGQERSRTQRDRAERDKHGKEEREEDQRTPMVRLKKERRKREKRKEEASKNQPGQGDSRLVYVFLCEAERYWSNNYVFCLEFEAKNADVKQMRM
jgi:hypothetical protein